MVAVFISIEHWLTTIVIPPEALHVLRSATGGACSDDCLEEAAKGLRNHLISQLGDN